MELVAASGRMMRSRLSLRSARVGRSVKSIAGGGGSCDMVSCSSVSGTSVADKLAADRFCVAIFTRERETRSTDLSVYSITTVVGCSDFTKKGPLDIRATLWRCSLRFLGPPGEIPSNLI